MTEADTLENEIAGLLVQKDEEKDPEKKRALRARVMDLRARLDLIRAGERARISPNAQRIAVPGTPSQFDAPFGAR